MKGMNILEQTAIKEPTTSAWICVSLGIIIALIFVIIFGITKKATFLIGYVLGLVVAIFAMFLRTETDRYMYKCTFDDNVAINDVSKTFDIVEFQDGIWTLKDKIK